MISFDSVMKTEKLAVIALAIIIAGVLSAYLLVTYGDEILDNLTGSTETIEIGDCVDVNYTGSFENGTVFDTSYEDVANDSGIYDSTRTYGPLKTFVSFDLTGLSPEGYESYFPGIEGFMEGLIGLKEGETKTLDPIPPEKAYGVLPELGSIINLSELANYTLIYEVYEVQEDVPMPLDFEYYYGNVTTTLYGLRESWHYIGEIIETSYPCWDNSSVVTGINETVIGMYITPSTAVNESFTYIEYDSSSGIETIYPEDASTVTNITNDTIVVKHTPAINDAIELNYLGGSVSYTVENVTNDIINVSYLIDTGGNKSYVEFDRTVTIQRNQTQNITVPAFPGEYLEEELLFYLRAEYPDFHLSYHDYASKTLYFDVEIVNIYKTSQQ